MKIRHAAPGTISISIKDINKFLISKYPSIRKLIVDLASTDRNIRDHVSGISYQFGIDWDFGIYPRYMDDIIPFPGERLTIGEIASKYGSSEDGAQDCTHYDCVAFRFRNGLTAVVPKPLADPDFVPTSFTFRKITHGGETMPRNFSRARSFSVAKQEDPLMWSDMAKRRFPDAIELHPSPRLYSAETLFNPEQLREIIGKYLERLITANYSGGPSADSSVFPVDMILPFPTLMGRLGLISVFRNR